MRHDHMSPVGASALTNRLPKICTCARGEFANTTTMTGLSRDAVGNVATDHEIRQKRYEQRMKAIRRQKQQQQQKQHGSSAGDTDDDSVNGACFCIAEEDPDRLLSCFWPCSLHGDAPCKTKSHHRRHDVEEKDKKDLGLFRSRFVEHESVPINHEFGFREGRQTIFVPPPPPPPPPSVTGRRRRKSVMAAS